VSIDYLETFCDSPLRVPENALPELFLSSLLPPYCCGLYDKVSTRFSLNVGFFFGSSGFWPPRPNFLRLKADLGVLALDLSIKETCELEMRRTLMSGLYFFVSMKSIYRGSGDLLSSS